MIIENLKIQNEEDISRFDGIWNSSLIDSTSKGKPNLGLSNRMQTLTEILESTTKPIIYDEDKIITSSYLNYTIQNLESNGISYLESDIFDPNNPSDGKYFPSMFSIIIKVNRLFYSIFL